ncbi:hypothetical protein [Porphyromonas endodontalis]|uniref:hypothetical protein n=1 Tax=Porphyromonas endodontalis TaxID=28124 RepID=UPI0023F4053F|nr:hypothetical protein [Porphyromonas endodontalis]
MKRIQERLEDWAKEAYDFYYPKAKELDMDFYTQSNLRLISEDEPVHLMVIGINPGFGGRFQPDRFKESSDILDGNVVDGNPVKIQGFRILKTLRSILEYSGNGGLLDDEKTFVFTNATFFSTHKESGLANSGVREAQRDSIRYTKSLIEIIQPKHIICLGGENCIHLLVRNTQPLLSNTAKLEYGVIGNIPVYGIKHTSSYWSSEEKELVGKALGNAFAIDSKPIDLESWNMTTKELINVFIQKRNDRKEINLKTHFQWEHIYISLCKYCKDNLNLEVSEEKEDWKRFSIKDSGGNDWLILALINQEGNKGIGIRYQKKNQPKDDDFEMILSRLQRIDPGFKPNISKEKVIWIGWLNLLNLQCKDADGCIEGSKRLLDEIIRALSEHI